MNQKRMMFIRGTRKLYALDETPTGEHTRMIIEFIRWGARNRKVEIGMAAAKKLLQALEEAGWNIRPAITGWDIGWSAKSWSHIGEKKYMQDYMKARAAQKEPRREAPPGAA